MCRAPLLLLALALACSPSAPRSSRDGSVTTPTLDGGAGTDAGPLMLIDAGPMGPCTSGAGRDEDGDGFVYENDCNDCAAGINPGAYDAPGNAVDEDCSGADATEEICDQGLPLAPSAGEEAARAIGICATASTDGWGLVSARFSQVDGISSPDSMTQVGLLPTFGSNAPLSGASMLALSSGVARAPGQSGFTQACDDFGLLFDPFAQPENLPAGFTVPSSPSCPGVRSGGVFNSIALEVEIKVPTNATGFSFRSNFMTYEYPNYICSEFNDYFVALQQQEGGRWENIVFDSANNPVSVNNGLLQVCEAGEAGGKRFDCAQGRGALAGTGFGPETSCGQAAGDDPFGFGSPLTVGAGTGWLRTVSPVEGGSTLRLRFAIWDSGDFDLDSLVLIDGFEWELAPITEIVTEPELI